MISALECTRSVAAISLFMPNPTWAERGTAIFASVEMQSRSDAAEAAPKAQQHPLQRSKTQSVDRSENDCTLTKLNKNPCAPIALISDVVDYFRTIRPVCSRVKLLWDGIFGRASQLNFARGHLDREALMVSFNVHTKQRFGRANWLACKTRVLSRTPCQAFNGINFLDKPLALPDCVHTQGSTGISS